MQHDGRAVTVPFPSGLMSSARSPAAMPSNYAVELRNVLLAADGAGVKRNGFSRVGVPVTGGMITGIFGYLYNGAVQILASVSDGSIRLQKADLSGWDTLQSGLNPMGVVRAVTFAGKLVLCNGTDDLLVWDGVTLQPVQEFVTDLSNGLTYMGGNQFRINSEVALYPVGRRVRARLGGSAYVEANVIASQQSGEMTTVILDASVLTSALDQMAYRKRPPRFAYLYAAHDRLWGMGQGAISRGFSGQVDRSQVFYSHGLNNPLAWHDSTGVVPGINLADKAATAANGGDELVAMAVKDGLTLFFGRQVTQVWQGTNPTATGDMSWQKTLPVGVPHAGLVVELPNDVLFINAGGARTLSRALQTEQLDVNDVGSEVDPTLRQLMAQVLADEGYFKRVRHGRCDGQNWFGVLLPGMMVVLQVVPGGGSPQRARHGWTMFNGLPAQAGSMGTLPDGRLMMSMGGQVYAYDSNAWADDGVDITLRWQTPWLAATSTRGRRWANQYVEVLTEPGPQTVLTLWRYRDYDIFNPARLTLPANQRASLWDNADWDVAAWDSASPPPALVRDHHIAETMSYAVENSSATGPLTVFGLRLYGLPERGGR